MIIIAVRRPSSTEVSNFGHHSLKSPIVNPAGHYERQPYDKSTMRSIYHIREFNVLRLSLVSKNTQMKGENKKKEQSGIECEYWSLALIAGRLSIS